MFGDGTPAAPLASATVLLLRDGPSGLEVYLIRRHGRSDVLGGAHVFPGGKVDRDDLGLLRMLDRSPAQLRSALAEGRTPEPLAAALHVAAIREVFEEASVLFAKPAARARIATAQTAHRPLGDVLRLFDLTLHTHALVPWARWLTPVASRLARKHFDARFFVAELPSGQQPVHDTRETTQGVWYTPRAALEDYWARRIDLPPPQIMSFVRLLAFDSVRAVLMDARARAPVCVQPHAVHDEEASFVCYPGDPSHPQGKCAMPGPTRLVWRGDRYEPHGGLEALLDRT